MFNGFPMPKPDSGGGGSSVKRVRSSSVYTQLATGVSSLNVTIDPVDVDNSIILVTSMPQEHNVTMGRYFISAELTNPTNVFLQRTDNGSTCNCSFNVIEFQGLKSFQKGTVTVSGSGVTVVINQVNLLKTIVFVNFRTLLDYPFCPFRFLDNTSLRFDQPVNPSTLGSTKIVNYFVVEFN